jgi:GMP synthase-like glutamine amidotransferase
MDNGLLHVIQNDPEVPLGNYAAFLALQRVPHAVTAAFAGEPLPTVGAGDALLVLGGAMGVGDVDRHPFLLQVKALIRRCLDVQIPYLGLCLGGQLLAEVAGGRVISNRWEELGTLPVQLTAAGERAPLFHGVANRFVTFQWHHDSFDLPADARLLALSADCPHQAFSVGTTAFGLQFHPEMERSVVADWCRWSSETAATAEATLQAFTAVEAEYRVTSWKILGNFLGLAGLLRE